MKPRLSLLIGILIILLAIPVFGHLDRLPIVLWDESRLAVNALEMFQDGDWLVTHFEGKPDMWNTKPPLLIWLQAFAIRLIGPSELAIRLPVALAAIFTCCLLLVFFTRKANKPLLGFLAALILVTAPGYNMLHGIRTGDYDGMLCLFTTSAVLSFFLYLEENKGKYLLATWLAFALAVLTKGVAGLLFTPALFLYAVYRRRILVILKTRSFYWGLSLFLVLVGGYYLLREHYNPGYLQAVWDNELTGRYAQVLEGHTGGFWYNINLVPDASFTMYCVLIIPGVIIGFLSAHDFIRHFTGLCVAIIVSFYLILSFGATKIFWYDLPAYPFLSCLVAIAIHGIFIPETQTGKDKSYRWRVFGMLSLLVFPYLEIVSRISNPLKNEPYDEHRDMAFFLKDVLHGKRNISGYTIVWHETYDASLNWYKAVFNQQRRNIEDNSRYFLNPDDIVVAFVPGHKKDIEMIYNVEPTDSYKTVKIYRIKGRKPEYN